MIRYLPLALALTGCLQTVSFSDNPLAGLTALAIEPTETTIQITDLAQPPTAIDYVVTGAFDDGTTRDVTALVGWSVDNAAPGKIVRAGRYETSQAAAGHVVVRAFANDIEATSAVHVIVTLTVVDSVFPPPVGAEALFSPAAPIVVGDPMRSPGLLYPAAGTQFPQGLLHLLFQIATGRNNDAYRLRFESDVLHLTVLTGSDRWQADATMWALIARSHPAARSELTVDAASTAVPGTIYSADPVPLWFSRGAPGGVIYYWSAATSGVMRATPSAASATKLYPSESNPTCGGCHAVSRDGTTMVLGYDGEKQQTVTLGDLAVVDNAAAGKPMGWAAFSPTGELVLIADKGTLVLRDARTGAPIGLDGGRVPLALKATHPDWSPDGSYVAVTLAADVTNMEVKAGSIARIAYLGESGWGEPEILVASAADNNYFPRWSPDGRYLAYVRALEPSRGAPTATLRIVPAAGGDPIALRLASHRVGRTDDTPNLANTMPAWGPAHDDVAWLAFASIRPYGAVRPITGPSQIWIAAIDLNAPAGADPSFPAFWLPSQDIRVLGNNPIWAVEPTRTE